MAVEKNYHRYRMELLNIKHDLALFMKVQNDLYAIHVLKA
ncbi:hypothetical protein NIES4073_10660 [Kalymmatonema gypsitolerans NIES-4073]|nr:hypothetical protein NIES4073_10660 [Scytonema sp. NIES-4073]